MTQHRLKHAESTHIKNVIASVIRSCRKESNTALYEIKRIWNAELDKAFTDHAQATALKGETLLVTVRSSTLAHQLRFLTNDILHIINREAPHLRISEIKIKTGNF